VSGRIETAAKGATQIRNNLSDELRGYELSEHIDTGVYDTLGEYVKYIEQYLSFVGGRGEEWQAAMTMKNRV
jgi:hypothetical protein